MYNDLFIQIGVEMRSYTPSWHMITPIDIKGMPKERGSVQMQIPLMYKINHILAKEKSND